MKYDFDKLLTEYEFVQIKRRVEKFEIFEFEKSDKTRKFKIAITAHPCDNGIWQDNYMVSISCNYNLGGFGSPYQRAEFLTLDFDKVVDRFCATLDIERDTRAKQTNMFDLPCKGVN